VTQTALRNEETVLELASCCAVLTTVAKDGAADIFDQLQESLKHSESAIDEFF
jgi:hypothetical protein